MVRRDIRRAANHCPCANMDVDLDRYARAEKGHTDRSDGWWPAPYWDIDTGFASLLILLTAIDLGLGACFFGLPTDRIDAFREAFACQRSSGRSARSPSATPQSS